MAAAKKLGVIDALFLATESRESMMHVGGLLVFSPPPDAPTGFLRALADGLRDQPAVQAPWNLHLRRPDMLKNPLNSWVEDKDFDLDYHVRRSALPAPGDERELGILVSRLHGIQMDFHRRCGRCISSRGSRAAASRCTSRSTTRCSTATPACACWRPACRPTPTSGRRRSSSPGRRAPGWPGWGAARRPPWRPCSRCCAARPAPCATSGGRSPAWCAPRAPRTRRWWRRCRRRARS